MSMINFGAIDNALLTWVLKGGKKFTFVDGKADAATAPTLMRLTRRFELTKVKCKRRNVRFLPSQVMRPILTENQVL